MIFMAQTQPNIPDLRRLARVIRSLSLRAGDSKPKPEPLWESKILLLLLGALLTNFLAPKIQHELERIKWQRQQQVEQGRLLIGSLRSVANDVAELNSKGSEIESLCRIVTSSTASPERATQFHQRFTNLHADWHRVAGRIAAQTSVFGESGSMRESFQRYHLTSLETVLMYRDAALKPDGVDQLTKLRLRYSGELNNQYETMQNIIRSALHEATRRLEAQLAGREEEVK